MAEPLNPEKVEYQEFMHALEGLSVETVKEVAWRHYATAEKRRRKIAELVKDKLVKDNAQFGQVERDDLIG